MESSRRLALALVLAAALGALSGEALYAQANAGRSISVSTAAQLVEAIGPDRTIVLKKGVYLLSSAYGVESDYATWTEGDDGSELSIDNVQNLTIRGASDAKIVSDSGLSSIIGFYDSKNVTLDNLSFSRSAKADEDMGAGSFYAESVTGLVIDRCSFEGGTTVAIELYDCKDVAIKRTSVTGADLGALSAVSTASLTLSGFKVKDCSGYPLFLFENSGEVLIKGSVIEGNGGGNLVEIYSDDGSEPSIAFSDCDFRNNDVEYFAGSGPLPSAEGCRFDGNSFGEDWAVASVAPASEDEEYEEDSGDYEDYEDYASEGPQVYEHPAGLSLTYPGYWEMQEYEGQARVGFFSPDSKSLVIFLPASELGANVDPAKQAKKVFADAYAAFAKLLKAESEVALDLKAEGEPYTDNGLLSADYRGLATKGEGEKAQARARFVVMDRAVYVIVGLAEDSAAFESEGDIDGIFASLAQSE